MTDCPEPGIYEGVADKVYFGWDAVNNSSLSPALRSMAHYKAALEHKRPATPAMEFGRFVHTVVLEPEILAKQYVVIPDLVAELEGEYKNPRATKEYREKLAAFHDLHVDKQVIEADAYEKAIAMIDSVKRCSKASGYLRNDGASETSIVWNDKLTGVRCKARIDKVVEKGLLADLKTTADASQFSKSMANFGYARQAAFYCDGMETLTGEPHRLAFVAVEKEPPFGTISAPVSEAAIEFGRRQYQQVLRKICEAVAYDKWPAYEQPAEFDLPLWAYQSEDVVLKVGGEEVRL
tara:strand:- start:10833 stop:11711 length:879 start_codon:yes stop_codon:yes gene_type:complete